MSKFNNPTKVITGPETRWSYANVWDAKSINGGAPKFSVSLIILSLIQRLWKRLRLQFRQLMKKDRVN